MAISLEALQRPWNGLCHHRLVLASKMLGVAVALIALNILSLCSLSCGLAEIRNQRFCLLIQHAVSLRVSARRAGDRGQRELCG